MSATADDEPVLAETTRNVPVIQETLEVTKRVVDAGGFRLTKHVTEREQVVDEELRFYDVHVERHPVGRLLDTDELPPSRYEGDTIVISVVEEVLVTQKRLMLKEEIRITRAASVRRQQETMSLRSEDVSVERLDP